MKINNEAPPIKAAEGEESRFRWTTDETVLEKEGIGKRWMTTAPMASDGLYIYTLVFYREGNSTSTKKATFCEVYSLEANVIKFVKEIKLLDEANQPWVGGLKKDGDYGTGGYFDRGMLATNGRILAWTSGRNVHTFSLKSGKRLKRIRFAPDNSWNWVSCYDMASS